MLVWVALNFTQGRGALHCVQCVHSPRCIKSLRNAGIACKVIVLSFTKCMHCKQRACIKLYASLHTMRALLLAGNHA